jgi:hypothetical protein
MSDITLTQILDLVGKLDDGPGEETARERFRKFLKENVKEIGDIRDYIEECLRNSGDQYSRALQDLVNYTGCFLGFQVTFGRYHGIRGEIGFDGHWVSPKDRHIVIEVKTTEVYAIKTATLLNYINALISEKKIPTSHHALGLYVIGRPDSEVRQIENEIVAEKRAEQLRVISIESLVSLAELMTEYDVTHDDILAVLWPSGPRIDKIIDLVTRLAAQRQVTEVTAEVEPSTVEQTEEQSHVAYWLTPVKDDEARTAEEAIKILVGEEKIYAFGERTPGRRYLKPGDHICFYATGKGVVAHAKVTSTAEYKPHHAVHEPKKYPWTFRLQDIHLYLRDPIVIDVALRAQLDAFKNRDASKAWAWLVQATRRISGHDFSILTRHDG